MKSSPEHRAHLDRRDDERRQELQPGKHLHLGGVLLEDRRNKERRDSERRLKPTS